MSWGTGRKKIAAGHVHLMVRCNPLVKVIITHQKLKSNYSCFSPFLAGSLFTFSLDSRNGYTPSFVPRTALLCVPHKYGTNCPTVLFTIVS